MYRNCFLESERLYFRPFESGDEEFFLKWYNDKETRAKIGQVLPVMEAQAEKLVKRNSEDSVWFAVVRKADDAVIGEVGLLRMFPAWRNTDLTIIIPDEKDQGKGYGTEAINLLMDYAFGYLAFHRISIGVVGFNEKAIKFYEKAGFKKEGIQEQGYYYNHRFYDFVMMRILEEEFRAMHPLE